MHWDDVVYAAELCRPPGDAGRVPPPCGCGSEGTPHGEAQRNAHAGGRSVGDHASCSQMFDADMVRAVMEHESAMVSELKLGGCC